MEPARTEGRSPTAAADDGVLVSRGREVPDVSYRAFLAAQAPPRIHWANFEGLELAGAGAAVSVTAAGPDRFPALRDGAAAVYDDVDYEGHAAARPRMLGGLAFADDHAGGDPWGDFPTAGFALPEVQLTRSDDGTWLTVSRYGTDVTPDEVAADLDAACEALADLPAMIPSGGTPGVRRTRRGATKAEWTAGVADAVERIEAGELVKVALALDLEVDLLEDVDPLNVLERLRRTYPNCYRFLVQPSDDAAFVGAPPERLVKLTDGTVQTEALAGSVGRGGTPEADAQLAQSLTESPKIDHEQRLVVDTICEQLSAFGTVHEHDRRVRKLATIQHLQTPIEADLDGDEHVLSIVEALHPTPAVGGVPADVALATITDTETFDRGWYASPIGWFDAAGDGEFCVGIRAGVLGGTDATLFGGNGIVGDSDPAEEWEEVQLKFRPILDELE